MFYKQDCGIIEDMKTAQRNKCEKLKIVNLDTTQYYFIYQASQIQKFQICFSACDDLDF